MKPDNCESCLKERTLHGHHDDYTKPLGVRWLCQECHALWHMTNEPKGSQQKAAA